MKRGQSLNLVCAALAIFAAACATVSAAGARSSVAPRSSGAAGVLTVSNIPQKYLDGVILVRGENARGDTFTYSPKWFQRCEATTMSIKIFSSVGMTQTPFTGSGEFDVTIDLYETDHTKTEKKTVKANFVNGSAEVVW